MVDDFVRSLLRALVAPAIPNAAVFGKRARGSAMPPGGHIPGNSAIVAFSTLRSTAPQRLSLNLD